MKHNMEEKNELEALKAQCEEYLAGWKRAQADYANFKKEMEKERAEIFKYANEHFARDFLPAIDQFEIAISFTPDISALPEQEQERLKNWLVGLHAVRDIWEQVFQTIGLSKVREVGKFDPEIHEAVKEEDSEQEPGTILSVQQTGWKLKDKLLRPAKVTIAKI